MASGAARRAYIVSLLLSLALVAAKPSSGKKGKAAEAAPPAPTFVTVKFQPGGLGLGADWDSGRVDRVESGGQGSRKGVEVGMYFHEVAGQRYSEKLLDSMIARGRDFEVVFEKLPQLPTPKPKKDEEDVPPKPDYEYATELNHDTFKELVYKFTNGSEAPDALRRPPYFPVVMFHVSWCKHCKHALPEFEKAAKSLAEAEKAGQFRGYEAVPKFFVMECDVPAEHKAVCDMYTEANFPSINTFRDNRMVHFNRPRMAQTFAWWAHHVTRPPITQVTTEKDMKSFEQAGIAFILNADSSAEAALLKDWREVALDHIEEHHFLVAKPGSEVAGKLPKAPSVSVQGPGLQPLPFQGDMDQDSLARWVKFNQFPPLVELGPYNTPALKGSGYPVVALTYDSTEEMSKPREHFEFKAKQLRPDGQFIFATFDVSREGHVDWLSKMFPLLAPKSCAPPCLFVFSDGDNYWEDPSFKDPSAMSMDTIGALLANPEALQDGSNAAWVKEKRKVVLRFATGSALGAAVTIGGPIILTLLVWMCVKSLMAGDEEAAVTQKKVD